MLKRPGVRKIVEDTVSKITVSDGSSFELLIQRLNAGLRAYTKEERKRVCATCANLAEAVATLRQEVLGNPRCDVRRQRLNEKEAQLKEYLARRQDRLLLLAGLDRELTSEISSKQLSSMVKKPLPGKKLSPWNTGELEAEWTEAEVKAAFSAMADNKSPGLDGLPKELFEMHGDLLGGSFMALVKDFTTSATLPTDIKAAVTILLHKKGEKDQLNNYRPITLLNFTYKVLARVVADRIKTVLHRVISPEQYGFLPGRRASDAVALVADIIDAAKNGSEDWFLLLVYFQKAFDSVSHGFVFEVMRKMGFPPRLVSWIEGLHTNTTTRLLINGWLGEGIDVASGVRQGCPLAPYIFLCAVEPLAQEVERKKLGICKAGMRLGYLGYADDTTLPLQGEQQIKKAEKLLDKFEKMSGLATNKEKSVVLPLGANRGRPSRGAFKWAKPGDAERLLGVWVTPDGDGQQTWDLALGDITKKLVSWRKKYPTVKARTAMVNNYIQLKVASQAQVYPVRTYM
ncbi:unnamed protein product [Closterium sp. NIES-65]|nr:unnamed protein product [Closterium sp. NIES-65]